MTLTVKTTHPQTQLQATALIVTAPLILQEVIQTQRIQITQLVPILMTHLQAIAPAVTQLTLVIAQMMEIQLILEEIVKQMEEVLQMEQIPTIRLILIKTRIAIQQTREEMEIVATINQIQILLKMEVIPQLATIPAQ